LLDSSSKPSVALDLAFPPADGAIRECLTRVLDLSGVTKRFLKFFASIFKVTRDELRQNKGQFSDSRTLAEWWSTNFGDIREKLYSLVAEDTEKEITIQVSVKVSYGNPSYCPCRKTSWKPSVNLLLKIKMRPLSASEVEQVALQNKAISELDELLTELRAKCSQQPSYAIEIVMYFDEAHSLTALKPKNENEKTLYDVFCSVLNTFLRYPVFVIFLSTNSDLAELATPRSLAQSARIRDGRATIHAPITETPFDCYPDMLIRPVTMSFVETTTVEYMAKFGRPL
jgi:hypothetical protein